MTDQMNIDVNTFRTAVHVTSAIAHELKLPLSGTRCDGGVLGFGKLSDSLSKVAYNIDGNVIYYYPENLTSGQRHLLQGIATEHDINMDELYLELDEEITEEA